MIKLLNVLLLIFTCILNAAIADPIRIDGSKEIYASCSLSSSKIIVNESLVYTLSIYSMVNLAGLDIDEIILANTKVSIVEGATTEKVVINNLEYMHHKIKYSITPHKDGVYTIPSLSLIAKVKNDTIASELIRGKEVIFFTKEKEFTVKHRSATPI